jgi:NSS family neurotransmitter:Na+ symporter
LARSPEKPRETFASNFGLLMTMVGVAVGLGNIWRFPYMVGEFGGAVFVLFYILMVLTVGIPAMMAEWTLGRHTRRGTLGAFEKGGLPLGKFVGYLFFFVVICATGYYTNAVGWVGYHALNELLGAFGGGIDAAAILPPESGFSLKSLLLQLTMTGIVISTCGFVLLRGLRGGIEKVSKVIIPGLFIILIILIIRSLTLPGAGAGVKWFIASFDPADLNASVMAAALGQAIFSLSLGGTFMVVYGSYLSRETNIARNAVFTATGDLLAGLLAGLAIFPALFAFGMEPAAGPGLLFFTLPQLFAAMPVGWLFGLLFFVGLFGAAYLSDVAAFEVLVAGIVDNTRLTRRRAVFCICAVVYLVAIPPMLSMKVFVPWDLLFGSGMQTLGSLIAVITVVWFIRRADALKEMSLDGKPFPVVLYWWMRVAVPLAILFVGITWLLEAVFGISLIG